MPRWIEWLLIVAAALAIAIGVIALLSGGLVAGNDTPGIAGSDTGPGTAFRDLGDANLRPGQPVPAYDSTPPTSGPHVPQPVTADRTQLNDNQLLTALEVGDVVFMYGTRTPSRTLTEAARAVAPPFTPQLAASGQAVVLASMPGIPGIAALAWGHMLRTGSPADPALRSFAQFWLGRGAPARSGALPRS